MLNDFFDMLNKLHTEQTELAAIWLQKPLQTKMERTCRITAGQLVKVENGKLIDCNDEATHKIILCVGTLYNQFEVTVIDLITNEPLQIKI